MKNTINWKTTAGIDNQELLNLCYNALDLGSGADTPEFRALNAPGARKAITPCLTNFAVRCFEIALDDLIDFAEEDSSGERWYMTLAWLHKHADRINENIAPWAA